MQEREMEELLYRLDERTMRIEDGLEEIREVNARQEKELDDLDSRVQKNETKIKGALGLLGGTASLSTGALAKVLGILRI